jgi:hypothetical protein
VNLSPSFLDRQLLSYLIRKFSFGAKASLTNSSQPFDTLSTTAFFCRDKISGGWWKERSLHSALSLQFYEQC